MLETACQTCGPLAGTYSPGDLLILALKKKKQPLILHVLFKSCTHIEGLGNNFKETDLRKHEYIIFKFSECLILLFSKLSRNLAILTPDSVV